MDSSEDIMLSLLGEDIRECLKTVNSAIANFVIERYPPWADCPLEDLRAWLTWHWCQELVAAIVDSNSGQLSAVVVVRYLDAPEQYETAYCHKAKGPICYVELAISESPASLLAAFEWIRLKHGDPEYIIHERSRHGTGVKLRSWKRYRALLEKQNGSK